MLSTLSKYPKSRSKLVYLVLSAKMSTTASLDAPVAQSAGNLASVATAHPTHNHRSKHTQAIAHVPSRAAHYDTSLSIPVRKYLQTYGLTPPRAESYEVQKKRCLAQLALKPTDLERFLYL